MTTYVNSWIREDIGGGGGADSGDGMARITNVISATEVEVEIYTAFSSTTPTVSRVKLPAPHPDDYADNYAISAGDYDDGFANSCRALALTGIDTSAALAWVKALPGFADDKTYWTLDE